MCACARARVCVCVCVMEKYWSIPSRCSRLFSDSRAEHGDNNINPLNAELNPICHLLALLGTHPILHVSRIRVKQATTLVRKPAFTDRLTTYTYHPQLKVAAKRRQINNKNKTESNTITQRTAKTRDDALEPHDCMNFRVNVNGHSCGINPC